jgi:hypothetical protein
MCAPLIVPPVAPLAPVTRVKKRAVSPEPVEVKVSRLKLRRVSPDVAEVTAYAPLRTPAEVIAIGSLDEPTWNESSWGSAYATPIGLLFAMIKFLYQFQKGKTGAKAPINYIKNAE